MLYRDFKLKGSTSVLYSLGDVPVLSLVFRDARCSHCVVCHLYLVMLILSCEENPSELDFWRGKKSFDSSLIPRNFKKIPIISIIFKLGNCSRRMKLIQK